MKKNDVFESKRLLYRGISEADTDHLVKWRSNESLVKYFRNPDPITHDSHLEWYYQKYISDSSRFDFISIDKAAGRAVGYVGVSRIDPLEKSFEVFYMIGEQSAQRQGFAVEAITAMTAFMQAKGFTKSIAVIHKDNIPSIRTAEKTGFVCETSANTFREYVLYL